MNDSLEGAGMGNRIQTGFGIGLLVAGILCTAAAQQTHATTINVVVPGEYEDQPGDGGWTTLVRDVERTYQVQIAEEHLTDLAGLPLLGVRWRSRTDFANWPSEDLTWENYDITLAEAANSIDDFSETFADNLKPDTAVQVRRGPLTIEGGAFPREAGPNPWGPLIGFDTAYTYTGGDLVIEYRHDGNDQQSFGLDGVDPDAEAGYLAQFADSYEAESATFPSTGVIITQFEAVPSPTAAGLGMALMAGLVMRRPRRGRG